MNCPICNVTLLIADKQGIEIDYCPECRGVWLDRGELEKIIERSSSYSANQRPYRSKDDEHSEYDEHSGEHHEYKDGHKRKGFLWELFD